MALADRAAAAGYHKLVGKIFTSNEPSIALVKSCGWREVGVHRRHGRLDGEWKDVLVVERLLGSNVAGCAARPLPSDPEAMLSPDADRAPPSPAGSTGTGSSCC